jgi:signal peptidase I
VAAGKEFDKSIIEKKSNVFADFAEIAFVVLIVILAVVILRTQASMARGVDGTSMQNTYNSFESGYSGRGVYDTVRITKLAKIRRGDIVTFESRLPDGQGGFKILIKRVIGIGGDVLEIRDSGHGWLEMWRNGAKLDEQYINKDGSGKPKFTLKGDRELYKEFTVPKGCYFVMGDNRDNSTDSRYNSVGFIPFRKIEGKVYLDVRYGDNYLNALWNKIF